MAESDTAGPAPALGAAPSAPGAKGPTSLAEIQRDVERSTAPLRAATAAAAETFAKIVAPLEEAERLRWAMLDKALAPVREMERQQAALAASFGRCLREIVGGPASMATPAAPAEVPRDRLPRPSHPATTPQRPSSIVPTPPGVVFDTSPAAMSALVDLVVDKVVKRLTPSQAGTNGQQAAPAKGRRGQRRREISVGGVDAALEALAEEDPSVRVLAARDLVKRGVPYCRRTIEKCATYKAWRLDLKALRVEAAANDVAEVLDAGLIRMRKKKPGRGRLVDPTIDPAVEKMTKEFLRLHGEEGLNGG